LECYDRPRSLSEERVIHHSITMPSVSNLFSRNHGAATAAPPAASRSENDVSDFDWSRLPVLHRRTPHPWSVHCSDAARFVATICRVTDVYGKSVRHMQFQFPTERAAQKFAKAYSPPKLVGSRCYGCARQDSNAPPRHCRNCGVAVCEACSRRWAISMVPKTFVYNANNYPASLTVRVCKSCDWLSNAFCMALLQGRAADVYKLYDMVRFSGWAFFPFFIGFSPPASL
jgi:FYVE zinc finger